jgi:ubiquinone/menaquinone biosynthesis C-methylase UbiE
MSTEPIDAVRATDDAFASSFDDFNARYRFRAWTTKLLDQARDAGLGGRRLLDLNCGTGLSFVVPSRRASRSPAATSRDDRQRHFPSPLQ